MANNIVQLAVSQQIAPTPLTLQKSGAIVSQGATNQSQFAYALLTQLSDLTPLLNGSKPITSAAWSSGTATYTCTSAHGFPIGDVIDVTIAGFTPAGYNGTFFATVTTATAFTVAIASNPGSMTVAGSYTLEDVAEVLATSTSFFAQGSNQGIYVLEIGPADAVADGVAALSAYLTANPNSNYTAGAPGYFYDYIVPRTWDANAAFLSLLASYESPTAKTYFHVTTTLATYTAYSPLMKCVKLFIESPTLGVYPANVLTAISWTGGVVTATTTTAHGVAVGTWFQIAGVTPTGYNGWALALTGTTGSTLVYALATNPGVSSVLGTLVASYYANTAVPALEFSAASDAFVNLNRSPSNTNKVTPNAFAFVYGVTPFPQRGLSALNTALQAANVNIIGTGAEGGISSTIVVPGTTLDGNDFTYWYSVDWVQLTADQQLANTVINGSNNPINPLYYNQNGIDRLQAVLAQVMSNGITFGMVLGPVVQTQLDGPALAANIAAGMYTGQTIVNAVPFLAYSIANPGHYKIGLYQGLSVYYVPARGFRNILVNLVVSQFVAS